MKKTYLILIIIAILLAGFALNILLTGPVTARLSTLPIMRQFNLFKPQSPIVINNKETVRVSDANDAVEAANNVKSKISSIGYVEDAKLVVTGTVLNWTSDGYFVTTSTTLSVPGKDYIIITNDGRSFAVSAVYADTASNLVMLATSAKDVATVSTTDSRELKIGQKVLFIESAINSEISRFLQSYVTRVQSDVVNVVFSSDRLTRGFVPQTVGPTVPGQAIINLNSEVVGIWDGTTAIAGGTIRSFANNFFRDNLEVKRPGYGFSYRVVSEDEARIINLSLGAQVLSTGGSSLQAGLKAGDIITAVDGKKVSENALLEEMLEVYKPGDSVPLSVTRNNESINIVIVPKQL